MAYWGLISTGGDYDLPLGNITIAKITGMQKVILITTVKLLTHG